MKAMKTKIIVAIVMVAIFISTSTIGVSQCSPIDDDKPAPIAVKLKVRELFRGWYLIWVTVKNLEDERIILSTVRPAGSIYIRSYWEYHVCKYEKPGVTTMLAHPLFLRPHQEKIVYFILWNVNWGSPSPPQTYRGSFIHGCLRSYEYKGELYPLICDGPYSIGEPG